MKKKNSFRTWLVVCSACISVQVAYSVGYIISNYYALFQEASGYSNTQIGLLMTIMSTVSLFFYLPCGIIIDRLPIRYLFGCSAIVVGLCGFVIAVIPSYGIMLAVYVVYAVLCNGIMCNGAMVLYRLSSEKGTMPTTLGVSNTVSKLFTLVLSQAIILISARAASELAGFRTLASFYSVICIVTGIIVLVCFQAREENVETAGKKAGFNLKATLGILKNRYIWTIGLSCFAIYTAAASMTYLQPYLTTYFGISTTAASTLGTVKAYGVPVIMTPILAMVLTKNAETSLSSSKLIVIMLGLGAAGYAVYCFVNAAPAMAVIAIVLYVYICLTVEGVRYQMWNQPTDMRIPEEIYAQALGILSMIVFCSDIFWYTLCGKWIDQYGVNGYKIIFGVTICILAVGFVCALYNSRFIARIRKGEAKFEDTL